MNLVRPSLAALLSFLALPSFAVVDYSSLTSAIDVAGVTTALMSAASLMITVVVARWGIRKIIGFFR